MLIRKLLFFLFCYSICLVNAQNKYGLVIGINKYQKKDTNGEIVSDPNNALFGCVNDAKAIKQLLVQKFGFKSKEVVELYDFDATKKNILDGIDNLLKKSKPGDFITIFFAGHGSTFKYGENATQTAEYLLPTDMYSNYTFFSDKSYEYSYIQTSQLANLFNEFVKKKVVLTAIFDCCYSKGTIGVKKTIPTRKIINGVPKLFSNSFWESKAEMSKPIPFPVERDGLIPFPASDRIIKNSCSDSEIQEALSKWLNLNGYAYANNGFTCPIAYGTKRDSLKEKADTVIWTNNYTTDNWEKLCGKTRKVLVEFTARKNICNMTASTSATFTIIDEEKPFIYQTARDTIITNSNAALYKWLSSNGGALATDGCSDSIIWSTNFDSTMLAYFNASGSALVTFTATDACGISDKVSATITKADENNPPEYRLTAQETATILDLLEGLDGIRENVKNYFKWHSNNQQLEHQLLLQLEKLDTIKQVVFKKTAYAKTGNLDAIHGTPLMVSLLENSDNLLVLLSEIPFRPEDQLTDKQVNDNPFDSMEDDTSMVSRNANNVQHILPGGFLLKQYEFSPPSIMPGSKFVFISATNDMQKAKESKFNDTTHGVFTAALIEVFKSSPAGTKINDVFEKVNTLFKKWNIKQTPTLRVAEQRKNKNLIGTGN